MKLDMNKVYDRVEWGFLLETLKKLGFSSRWCGWVEECITKVQYSVVVNGREKKDSYHRKDSTW